MNKSKEILRIAFGFSKNSETLTKHLRLSRGGVVLRLIDPIEDIEGVIQDKFDILPRKDDVLRNFIEKTWLPKYPGALPRFLVRKMNSIQADRVYVPDLQCPDDARYLQKYGFKILKIVSKNTGELENREEMIDNNEWDGIITDSGDKSDPINSLEMYLEENNV